MKPLKTTKQILMWLHMCPAEKTLSTWKKAAYTTVTLVIFAINFANTLSGFMYVDVYRSTDLKGCLFAFMASFATLVVLYTMISAYRSRHRISQLLEDLDVICNNEQNQHDAATGHLNEANKISEWVCVICVIYLISTFISTAMLSLFVGIFCWFVDGYLDASHLYRPLKLLLPWEQMTLAGYLGEIFFSLGVVVASLTSNNLLLVLFVSIGFFHSAFYKIFKNSIHKFKYKRDKNQSDEKLICNLMRFHINAKSWFLDSTKIYGSLVGIQLINAANILAVSIVYIDMLFHHIDSSVAITLLATWAGISPLFIYCYFGKSATDCYAKMGDRVYYDLSWFNFPVKLQKYVILMVQNMQQPIHYHGFRIVILDLRLFIQLINKVFKFYMMFKAITTS